MTTFLTRLGLGLALLLAISIDGTPASAKDDPQAVRDSFVAARDALAAGNVASVLTYLSHDTRRRLEEIREAAKAPGQPSLAGMGPTGKIAVLSLRRFLSPAQLHRLDTETLVNQVLADGWLPPGAVGDSDLGPVSVKGERAAAVVKVKGKPTLMRAEFVREDDGWRIDLVRVMQVSDQLFRLFATSAGRTEDEYIADLVKKAHKP